MITRSLLYNVSSIYGTDPPPVNVPLPVKFPCCRVFGLSDYPSVINDKTAYDITRGIIPSVLFNVHYGNGKSDSWSRLKFI